MLGLEPTPLDVRLVAFRIPIRVHPSFWVVGAILGPGFDHPDLMFLWVMCLFISILVHELGHALIAEAFGWMSEIVLYWGGGLAMSQRYHNRTPWREIAVSLAGPCAGFGLFGLTLIIERLIPQPPSRQTYFLLIQMKWINLWWGLVNLLPVLPLDGGHICQSFLVWCRLRDPITLALRISVFVSALAAVFFFTQRQDNFAGMLFAMMCLQNVAALQAPTRSPW